MQRVGLPLFTISWRGKSGVSQSHGISTIPTPYEHKNQSSDRSVFTHGEECRGVPSYGGAANCVAIGEETLVDRSRQTVADGELILRGK